MSRAAQFNQNYYKSGIMILHFIYLYLQVVQAYVSYPKSNLITPRRQLVAFGRYVINNGQAIMVTFTINPDQLAVWDDTKGHVILPGMLRLLK